jgi:hypothetical protein
MIRGRVISLIVKALSMVFFLLLKVKWNLMTKKTMMMTTKRNGKIQTHRMKASRRMIKNLMRVQEQATRLKRKI